jgi:hypothetical protein
LYENVRNADEPRKVILEFFESAYRAGARRAGWEIENFAYPPARGLTA